MRERARFCRVVAIAQHEVGCHRQCAGHELVMANPGRLRRGIGRDDARIVSTAADDERTRGFSRVQRAREDVEGQRGKEEARP